MKFGLEIQQLLSKKINLMTELAFLLTSHNRKDKTYECLISLYNSNIPDNIKFDVFLVDDGSNDGTYDLVTTNCPDVVLINGTGQLYWAGGMRLAWNNAISTKKYNAFILINDDVILSEDFLFLFLNTDSFSKNKFQKSGIYSATTVSRINNNVTYSGNRIISNGLRLTSKRINPKNIPQAIDTVNANILWVDASVVNEIGILDKRFKHGIADYDYALRAKKANFPVLLTMGIGGYCENDKKSPNLNKSIINRIEYLKSPTGYSYYEYIYYLKKHYPLTLPYTIFSLWFKTIFPNTWNYFKSISND
jgi:GT2 family glycosyltransferase